MARRKKPDQMTAEDEVRSVLAWAQRMGYSAIVDALRHALAKWPKPAATDGETDRDTGRACGN